MSLKLQISQIFLPNPKQAHNYVSIYEEVVRSDTPVYLFLIVEIRGDAKNKASKYSSEFEKLSQQIARSLKQTYLHEERITTETFEKALANINHDLSQLAKKGIVKWYKKMNALIGVFVQDGFFVSVTGTANAYLLRSGEFTHITDSLSTGDKPHPLKTFVNFSSGSVAQDDTVILSTSNLYNYSSLEKIRQVFEDNNLTDATRNLIRDVKKDAVPEDAFATFFFQPMAKIPLTDHELRPLMAPEGSTIIEDVETFGRVSKPASGFFRALTTGMKALIDALAWLFSRLTSLTRFRRPGQQNSHLTATASPPSEPRKRRPYLAVFFMIFTILIVYLIFLNFRNAEKQTKDEIETELTAISDALTEAESALIYDDQAAATKSLTGLAERFSVVENTEYFPDLKDEIRSHLQKLLNQVNKITAIADFETLATFQSSPNQLASSPGGFTALNTFTDEVEFYNAETTSVTPVLSLNRQIDFVSATDGILGQEVTLLTADGSIFSFDFTTEELTTLFDTPDDESLDTSSLRIYNNRAYALEKTASQILRYNPAAEGFSSREAWLASPSNFSAAVDLAVDGDIFVLNSDGAEKFTRGVRQNFELQSLSTPMKNVSKIFTDAGFEFIYVLDPENNRVLVFSNKGTLATQLSSPQFNDLRDFWVDERNKLMYLLNGNQLIRFRY